MNGVSRIGSFLFGQGVYELAAEESTRMVDSDSGGESHVGPPVGERVHVVGDLDVSAVPRDVLGSSDDTLPSLGESYDLRQTPDIRQRQFPNTPRPQPQPQSYGGIFCRRFQQPLSEIESQGDSMTVNTSGGNVTSPTRCKYGTPFSTSDSLSAAARTSTDFDGSRSQTSDWVSHHRAGHLYLIGKEESIGHRHLKTDKHHLALSITRQVLSHRCGRF